MAKLVKSKDRTWSESIRDKVTEYPIVSGAVALGVAGYAIYKFVKSIRNSHQVVTVSAPGKALIAGGYLVLEHPNIGLVVSCTSRFYTTIGVLKSGDSSLGVAPTAQQLQVAKSYSCVMILVLSPQFHAHFMYSYNLNDFTLRLLTGNSNEFVEKCLLLVFAYLRKASGTFMELLNSYSASSSTLTLTLRADNDFYSQVRELKNRQLPLTSSSLSQLPKFMPCPLNAASGKVEVAKTGMGSSAALTTSLVGALLKFFGCVKLAGLASTRINEDRRVVHNLSQLAHAVAQGKIGSGFDVSAAVYGSQAYRRFDPKGFEALMDSATTGVLDDNLLFTAVNDTALWAQCSVNALTLPEGLDLIMGDVCGGSSSTSMARAVLAWKSSTTSANAQGCDAKTTWKALAEANLAMQEQLGLLRSCEVNFAADYRAVLQHASTHCAADWSAAKDLSTDNQLKTWQVLLRMKALFTQIRALLKTMGQAAGADIEPDAQTKLCNATEMLPGVLAAGVPGAGGHDAVFALVLSSDARSAVETLWSQWHLNTASASADAVEAVCPLLLRAETNPASAGVRVESLTL